MQRRLQSIDDGWAADVVALPSSAELDRCSLLGSNEPSCPDENPSGLDVSTPSGTSTVAVRLKCVADNCGYVPGGLYDFAVAIYSSTVTIEENVAPTVGALTTAGASAGGWFGSGGSIGMSGADTLGIRRFEVLAGEAVVGTVQRTCVDWSVLPCAEPAAGLTASATATTQMSTLNLGDGEHELRVRAVDAAGNTATSAPVTIGYDTSPRTAGAFVEAGLSNAQTRSIGWAVDGSGAPATRATARICSGTPAAPTDCREQAVAPSGPLTLDLADGATVNVAITLTDAAGNTSTSTPVELSRDATAPGAPTLALAGTSGANRTVNVGGEAGTRLDSRLCLIGGSCTALPSAVAPGSITLTLPTAGSYELIATLTDRARNTSVPTTLRLTRAGPLAEPKSIDLRVRVTSNLRERRIVATGTVAPGSTSRIDVVVAALSPRGKRITRRTRIAVPANGRFTKRLKLPAAASSRRRVQLTLTPSPNDGWRVTRYTHTIRP